VDDRVRPDALELRVVPRGPFRALVLAVADLERRPVQRLLHRRRGENELDHLPVALVQVVPVVEDVEEPVLEREPARVRGIARHMRVGGEPPFGAEVPLPVQVVAAGLERVAREVEVVAPEPAAESLGGRPDLDEVVPPGPAERNRRLAEEEVDVDRDVVHRRTAALAAGDEAHDGCVPLRERPLLREIASSDAGGCVRRERRVAGTGEQDRRGHPDAERSHLGPGNLSPRSRRAGSCIRRRVTTPSGFESRLTPPRSSQVR
jgi:hypothetical protein